MEKKYIINKNFGQRNMNNSLKGFQSGRFGKTWRDFLKNGGFINLGYFNKYIAVTKSQRYFSSVSHNASRSRNIASNNVAAFGHGKRYFSNSTCLFMHNGFNDNDNNNNKSSMTTSLAKKVSLFIMRITTSMVGVIACKSLFLSWYNDTYNWVEFCNNFCSLSSGLISIGILAGGLISKLLEFTPLNVNINNFLVDPSLKILKTLFLSWKDFVLNQDRIPIQDQPGATSSSGSQVAQPGASSSSASQVGGNTPSGSQEGPNEGTSSSIDDRPQRSKKRSHSEIETARERERLKYPKRPEESDEAYADRIKRTESDNHYKAKRGNVTRTKPRSPEVLKAGRDIIRETLTRDIAESDEEFNNRVNRAEWHSYNSATRNNFEATKRIYRTQDQILKDRDEARKSVFRQNEESDESFERRVKNRDNYIQQKRRRLGESRKFSTLSNSTKYSFSGYAGKLRLYLYRPTSYPRVGDKDFGKTSFKSYSTYSRNLILPSAKLKDGDKKLNNNNIFLKRAIYNFIKASVNNQIHGVHFQDSTVLITFLKEFDSDFNISRQSIHNYKKKKLVFKGFLVNSDVSRFLAYVNSIFPEFNPSAFLQKYSGTCMPTSAA